MARKTRNERPRLALAGAGEHAWPSVERTRRFYLEALDGDFELCRVEDGPAEVPFPDALLNFFGPHAWKLEEPPAYPVLYAMHGGPIVERDLLQARLGRLRSCDTLIVNCASDISLLREFYAGRGPRFCRLPLPVDNALLEPPPRELCREAVSIGEEALVLGFVARLLPQKGLHVFLRFLGEIRERLRPRPVEGLVVGNFWLDYPVLPYVTEEYPQYVQRLIGDLGLGESLHYFPARLSDEDLLSVYGAMDVLIHPTSSLDENFGYVPVEAMACGVPVVGAAYGGLKDTVEDGETGFLMASWPTASGLRLDHLRGLDAIEELLRDADLRRRFSRAARQRARRIYSKTTCGDRLREAVHEAIAAFRGGDRAPLELVPEPSKPTPGPYLPVLETPWEHYRPGVVHYASGPPPPMTPETRLRIAAPFTMEGSLLILDDPAWPARFELDEAGLAVAERCREKVTAKALESAGLADRERLEHFVEIGLLLASPPPGDPPAREKP